MKKNIHLPIAFLALIITFFTGCSKSDGETGDYYIRFKQDGVQKEYRTAVVADIPSNPTAGYYGAVITGLKEATAATEQMTLGLFDYKGAPIKVNQNYQMKFAASGGVDFLAYLTYNNAGDAHSSSVTVPDTRYESAHINITELTDKYVKGTFSGKILKDPAESSPTVLHTITDGEFYAQRITSGAVTPGGGSGGTGTGKDYIEFTLDGKTVRIDESTSAYSSASANFSSGGGVPVVYQCLFIGGSNILTTPFYSLTFGFGDLSPIEGKTYTISGSLATSLKPYYMFSLQYKEVPGPYFYFMRDPATTSKTTMTLTFTKFSNKKGEKVEGTFSLTNLLKTTQSATTLADNMALTNGKFSLTVN